jgi:hypothetical protein
LFSTEANIPEETFIFEFEVPTRSFSADRFFRDIADKELVKMFKNVFHFKGLKKESSMVKAFKEWVTEYFYVSRPTVATINRRNEIEPTQQHVFVNYLPPFGGSDETEMKKNQDTIIAKFK